jgi:hypothetical protein
MNPLIKARHKLDKFNGDCTSNIMSANKHDCILFTGEKKQRYYIGTKRLSPRNFAFCVYYNRDLDAKIKLIATCQNKKCINPLHNVISNDFCVKDDSPKEPSAKRQRLSIKEVKKINTILNETQIEENKNAITKLCKESGLSFNKLLDIKNKRIYGNIS